MQVELTRENRWQQRPQLTLGSRVGRLLSSVTGFLGGLFRGVAIKRRERTLQLCETLPLGDKRFLAVVRVQQQQFLVGCAGNSINLLARLSSSSDPAEAVIEIKKEPCVETGKIQHDKS